MKYLFMVLLLVSFANPVLAGDKIPYAGDFERDIRNYNRASTSLATAGSLGNGAVAELAEKGFSAIIDLRKEAEGVVVEKLAVEAAGMKYINIPITGEGVSDESLAEFAKAYEAIEGNVLLHCASGNRVGAMLTRYYLSKGVDENIAVEIGRTAGMRESMEATIVVLEPKITDIIETEIAK